MRCRKAKRLIPLYLAPDGSCLEPQDRRELEAHLAACESCRRDCEKTARGIAILRKYWRISPDTQALIDRGNERKAAGLPIDRLWRCRRPIEIGAPTLAMAACLAVLVLGWWALSNPSRRSVPPAGLIAGWEARTAPTIVAANGAAITPGALVQTQAGQIERLTLNTRHTVVMNAGTRLSIEPLPASGQIGCRINLALGEVYVHVAHDGLPFTVQTAHGWAIITGTTFDVRATEVDTTLIVVEGSVRFESENGAVHVFGGHRSTVAAESRLPSEPFACDAAAATVWARADQDDEGATPYVSTDDLEFKDLPVTSWEQIQTDTDTIEYATWIEQNRDWFRREFPWIFELKEALAREGIETDYPDMLLRSGDVWRFAYPPTALGRQIAPDSSSLVRAARYYGRDETWLRQHVPGPFPTADREKLATTSEAFERWVELTESQFGICSTENDSRALLDSLDACLYLAHTRTLAALELRVKDAVHWKSVVLLEEQLQALANCLRLLDELGLRGAVADARKNEEKSRALIGEIARLGQLDKEIREYENGLDQ